MAYARLPKRIKVGHAVYRVQAKELDEKYGDTQGDLSLIRVNKGMGAPAVRETLFHELLHALMHEASANEVLGITPEDQEKFVRVVSPWILGVLRDNPELVEFLLEDESEV